MGKAINLEREFIKWFYEEPYPEVGSNRCQYQANNSSINVDARDYWMRLAYKAGARRMAQDMLDTLADYACACEGLDPEQMTPSEAFDRARENLFVYATATLQKAKA